MAKGGSAAALVLLLGSLVILAEADLEEHQEQDRSGPEREQGDGDDLAREAAEEHAEQHADEHDHDDRSIRPHTRTRGHLRPPPRPAVARRADSAPATSGVPATPHEKSLQARSTASAGWSGSAASTSELIVSQARIPPSAASAAHTTIAMWKPWTIFAGL